MTIKWQGTDTKNVLKWNVEAESYYELLQKLIEKGSNRQLYRFRRIYIPRITRLFRRIANFKK